jgi:parallel beta-helix repeat protein
MLKKILLGLAFMLPITAHCATYYVSSSTGDDNNDGLSQNSPWQTIAKVNEVLFEDNSTILFKRGELFRGAISTNKFPTGITFGAYGNGDNPIIAGSVQITGWKRTSHSKLSSKVYEADVSNFIVEDDKGNVNSIQHLFVDGELMTIARYPNVDSPADTNWLQVENNPTTDVITDSALAAYDKPDSYWKGSMLRIRTYSWYYKVFEITSYSAKSGRIRATGLDDQLPEWGYFLDDKLEELDHPGEWYYDPIDQKVYLYPKNGANPNNLLVEGTTYDTGISISSGEDNTLVENLTFRHFTNIGVNVIGSNDVIVRNCDFEYNTTGVSTWNSANVLIANNTFNQHFSKSVGLSASSDFDVQNSVVEKNQMTNTGMFPLYCSRYPGVCYGTAVNVFGKAYTVRKNTIENCGWTCIYLKDGGHHIIENNVVRNALSLINDGGAIAIGSDGNVIRGNILLNSIGNVDESNGCGSLNNEPCMHHPSYGMGIGADNNYRDNVIEGNTVANNAHQGIRLNAFINSSVRNNVVYNNHKNQIVIEDKKGPSRNNVVENNIIYSLEPDKLGLSLTNTSNHGSFNNNFYCNPYSEVVLERDNKKYSLAHWKSEFSSYDQNSKWCGFRFQEYQASNVGSSLITNSTFETDTADWNGTTYDLGASKWIDALSHDTSQSELDGGSLKVQAKSQGTKVGPKQFELVENQFYRLKFSVIGSGFGTIQLRFNKATPGESWEILKERYYAYDSNRKDYEMFFQSPITTDYGKLLFSTQDYDAKTYWLDNVTFEPVDATLLDTTKKSVLFMNETENDKTISLGSKTYSDLNGNTVTGSITLTPYSSKILIFTGNTPLTNYTLTLQKAGTGNGTITSQPTGIDCGDDCTESYQTGTAITLTATADSGSTFAGFTGDANCSDSFSITADMNCTATFNKETVQPTNYTLTLQKAGTGTGTVTSQPTGVDCGDDCTESYQTGTAITLTATPDSGSTFAGFTGDANCSDSFSITADMNCTATFNKETVQPTNYTLTIQKAGTGNGTVSSQPTGVDCGDDCTESYQSGTAITLTATPDSGSTFAGFTGDANCSDSFSITADMNCTATFNKETVQPTNYTLTLQKAGTGTGTVTSQPTGIDCGDDCTESYQSGTAITLTATPDSGSTFAGFTGDANCSDSFSITADMNCTATFNKETVQPTNYTLTLQKAGTGTGTVTSQPTGVDCGDDCTESYQSGTAITLTATPDSGSTFAGFTGDANCSDSFSITADMNCTATFNRKAPPPTPNYTLTIQKEGSGTGIVSTQPTGIDCGDDCTGSYQSGSIIQLTASPEAGNLFTGWSGACEGTNSSTTVTLDATKECVANFEQSYSVTVTKMGNGTVTSQPAGIQCYEETNCTANYPIGTEITLVAKPEFDSLFIGFTGDEDCTDGQLTLNSAVQCVANFDLIFAGHFEVPECPTTETIDGPCNGQQQQTLTDITVTSEGRISHIDLAGNITNNGWISNATIKPNANVTGGILTGYINNQGTLADLEFRGEELSGGTLSGTISNANGGRIENVTVTENTRISGGQLGGQIIGNQQAPALLENLQVQTGSQLSGVIIGNNVKLPDDVKLTNITIGNEGQVNRVKLEGTITNNGVVSNVTIQPDATLSGGIVTGDITNQGTMADFQFSGDKLTGGNLSGTVTNINGGSIENVYLTANTVLSGGKVAGKITGESQAPARLENLEVQAGSELSGILIGDNVQLPEEVKLGKDVQFENHSLIPNHLELKELLPILSSEPSCANQLTLPERFDLSTDLVPNSDGILASLNQLPEAKNNSLKLTQDNLYGYLQLDIDTVRYAVQPLSIKRTAEAGGLQIQPESIRLITDTGLNIQTQSAVQAPCQLQAALQTLGYSNYLIRNNGYLKIASFENNWYSVQPDIFSTELSAPTADIGLYPIEPPIVSGLNMFKLIFTDNNGQQRQQLFYPVIAMPDALFLAEQEVVIQSNILVNFKLDGNSHRAVVGYLVSQSTPTTTDNAQILPLSYDVNEDGLNDFALRYSNGEQQTLFATPAAE